MEQRPVSWVRTIAKAVALRVVFWGGAIAMVALFLGDVRLLPSRLVEPEIAPGGSEPAGGAGWPHLRGPTFDGTSPETGLADSWPPEGPPVLWLRELGRGYSALAVAGNRVYAHQQDLAAQSVLCLDADSGRTLWSHRVGWPYEPSGMYPGPRSTPTWHDGRVYFASPYGEVGCLRADDGRPLWSIDVKQAFAGRGFDFGYSCSPLVVDGKVILPVGGKGASIVALDARNGSTLWTSGDEPASYASPVPLTLSGRRYAVVFLQNTLALVELATGRIAWQMRSSRGYDEHSAQPLYQEPCLVVACPFHAGARAYRLQPEAPEQPAGMEVEELWQNRDFSNDTASSVLVDGFVYGFDLRDPQARPHRPSRGEFRCLDLATGAVRWSSPVPGHATVIAADGKLLMFNDRGEILLARASPDRYEELGHARVFSGEICWTGPSLDRGRLFLRSPTQAACVYVGRPDRLAPDRLARARPATELTEARPLDWTWLVGGEREYPFDLPDARELGLWYAGSLLAGVVVPAAAAFLLQGLLAWRRRSCAGLAGRVVFWSLAFVLGLVATPLLSRACGAVVLTWPVTLFVAQHWTMTSMLWARRQGHGPRATLVSAVAFFGFLLVCLTYYRLCRHLGLAPQWIFLVGFLPSWPAALPAVYVSLRRARLSVDAVSLAVAFSFYFGVCALLTFARSP